MPTCPEKMDELSDNFHKGGGHFVAKFWSPHLANHFQCGVSENKILCHFTRLVILQYWPALQLSGSTLEGDGGRVLIAMGRNTSPCSWQASPSALPASSAAAATLDEAKGPVTVTSKAPSTNGYQGLYVNWIFVLKTTWIPGEISSVDLVVPLHPKWPGSWVD